MSAESDPQVVETSSRLRAWWLSTFGGYKVYSVHRTPKEGTFRSITYDSVYKLRPKVNGQHDGHK